MVDGTVYTVDDVLTALNARTSEREWQTDLGIEESPNSATQPAVADGNLVLASDSRLRSFDTAEGSKGWERTITRSPAQPVTVASDQQMGLTFFRRPEEGELPTELVAFGIETGEPEWTAPLSASRAPPAVFDDHVYVAGWSGPETGPSGVGSSLDWLIVVIGVLAGGALLALSWRYFRASRSSEGDTDRTIADPVENTEEPETLDLSHGQSLADERPEAAVL